MSLSSCGPTWLLKIISFISKIMDIAFIIIPIILIVFIVFDFIKSMSSVDKGNSGFKIAIKRILSAIMLFLVPTIVSLVLGLVGNTDYSYCLDNINTEEIKAIEENEKQIEELEQEANLLAIERQEELNTARAKELQNELSKLYADRSNANLDNVEDFEPILEIDESKKNVLLVTGHTRGYNAHTCNGVKHNEGDLVRDFARYLQVALYANGINAIIANEVVDPIDMNAEIIGERNRNMLESNLDLSKIDYVIELHFNAFSAALATGTEVVVSAMYDNDNRPDPLEIAIVKAAGKYIGTIRHLSANGKAIFRGNGNLADERYFRGNHGLNYTLIEIGFYDNCVVDMPNYYKYKVQIAEEMALGIKENL